jgi:hypothetical protein
MSLPLLARSTTPADGRASATGPWSLAWLGAAGIGVANGVAREATYGKRTSEQAAHQISAATAIAAFAGYFWILQRRWPLKDRDEALTVGLRWTALTVSFEFAFGRLVAKKPWSELMADYNLIRGRLWPLVLLWLEIGPEIIRRSATGQ